MATLRHNTAARLLSMALLGASSLLGCNDDSGGLVEADGTFQDFQLVYPVLLRDCGFNTCHGSEERFYRIYGPGRARLDEDTKAYDGITGAEASLSFQLAMSFIDAGDPRQSLILRKPLSSAAGGAAHEGLDPFGRDVYRTTNDEGYLALSRWVFSTKEKEPEPQSEEASE